MSKLAPTFLCFLLALSHVSSQLHADMEQAILLKLKTYWQNPSAISHWAPIPPSNSSAHCGWPEITCLNNSVIRLSLRNKTINKTIPSFLCDLENLKAIDLNYNNIPGEFPRTLYNCSKLEFLDLSQNYFVGTIPDDIDNLGQLQHLNLMANNFSGRIPTAIGRLHELKNLQLCVNQFNGSIPEEIGNLSKLDFLGLAYNKKFLPSNLPSSFKQLKKLKTLWMCQANLIGEIPDTIGDLTALEVLDFSNNELTGKIPAALFLLRNLKEIHLFANKLSGEIPQAIEASNLMMIDLSENNLRGRIPSDVGKLGYLSGLVLFSNQLSGAIPETIGRIPTLTDLRLFSNNLSGSLPPDFGRYSMLERFEVATNKFTGKLPEHLCNGGKLLGVVAFDNNLTGELPKSLGNCNSLLMVDVRRNGLTGSIPSGLWTSLNLSMLMASDNHFTGELPRKVSNSLSRLEISNNKFFGQIPDEVNSWRSLVVLKASNNLLNGTIPKALTALPILTTLLLDQNHLHGSLPSAMISWRMLNTLNLSQNEISGKIPEKIGFLPGLLELDLSRNQFSGLIPPELGLLRLTFLNLSNNLLIGNIPKQFENAAYSNGILNNLGLCASSPQINLENYRLKKSKSSSQKIKWISGTVVISFVLIVATFIIIKLCQKRKQASDAKWEFTSFQDLEFSESDILPELTEENKIGKGGSGNVYRVHLTCSDNDVAAKVISNDRRSLEDMNMLEKQFQAEVKILGGIRHSNIVKLLCSISSETTKVLVYEYLEKRSLDFWLHEHQAATVSTSTNKFFLDWPKRLHIAIGAADGLCYMHHCCSPPIIHRDVKSSNILLDSEFNAKIAVFGFAKLSMKQGNQDQSFAVSTLAFTCGYIAPEYFQTGRIKEKIDVYSFGVVLLELTTGRKATNGDEDRSLAQWAQQYFRDNNSIVDLLDKTIKQAPFLDQMCSVFKLGILCTRTSPTERPCMRKVVQRLLQSSHSCNCEDKNADKNYVVHDDIVKDDRPFRMNRPEPATQQNVASSSTQPLARRPQPVRAQGVFDDEDSYELDHESLGNRKQRNNLAPLSEAASGKGLPNTQQHGCSPPATTSRGKGPTHLTSSSPPPETAGQSSITQVYYSGLSLQHIQITAARLTATRNLVEEANRSRDEAAQARAAAADGQMKAEGERDAAMEARGDATQAQLESLGLEHERAMAAQLSDLQTQLPTEQSKISLFERRVAELEAQLAGQSHRVEQVSAETMERAQANLASDAHHYGMIYQRSTLLMTKQKYPELELDDIDCDKLEGVEDAEENPPVPIEEPAKAEAEVAEPGHDDEPASSENLI